MVSVVMKEHQWQEGGEGGEETPAAKVQALVCEECRKMPSKYKCPGCSIRTCSLPCVNSHKQRTSCSGKRHHSQLLTLSDFNDSVLLSDYNMLEEVKRVAESAQRTRAKLCPYSPYRLPIFLRALRSAAASRRTKLLLLPSGMSKRDGNQSRYDQRRRVISWTIEWRFHSTDVILHDHGIPEDSTLRSVIKKHLQPGPWNHQLRPFCNVQLDDLKFFIRKNHKGPKPPLRELNIDAPIRQQLVDLVILEYPVVHVFLPRHYSDLKISKDAHRIITKHRDVKDTDSSDLPHMKGVCFREEQIEENVPAESCKDELMDPMCHKMATNRPLLGGNLRAGDASLAPVIEEIGINDKDIELDFDQGLLDAYSELIAEMNPDEFLDLDGEYAGKGEAASVADEVEEGEILE